MSAPRHSFRARVTLVLSLALLAVACRSSAAREREAEAGRLGHLIDQLREAPNEAKEPALEALRQAQCDSEEGCALKSKCVSAYERHLGALVATRRTGALLASDSGNAAALLAAAELEKAERELTKAQALTEACASAQGELSRKVRGR